MKYGTERYEWIDSLKGISILGVIMIHSGSMGVGGLVTKIGQYGSSFVQAFFVISAFLIWKSLDQHTEPFSIAEGFKWISKENSRKFVYSFQKHIMKEKSPAVRKIFT